MEIDQNKLNEHSMTVTFTWVDLWDAFIRGAKEVLQNPTCSDKDINRGADCYCKMIQLERYKAAPAKAEQATPPNKRKVASR
jgi:hypothetical protein